MGIKSDLPVTSEAISAMGTTKVQALQNEFKQSVWLVKTGKGTISRAVLPLAARFLVVKRLDLYNKSRMTEDRQVRCCERLRGKFPRPTRPGGTF